MTALMRKVLSALPVIALLVALPQEARAQAAAGRPFGQDSIIVSADRLMGLFSYASVTTSQTIANVTTETTTSGPGLSVLLGGNRPRDLVHNIPRVSVDYALSMHLTLGGSVPLAFGLGGKEETKAANVTRSVDAPTTTIVGLAPRVGYILNVSDTFAIWPRAGFAYYSASEKATVRDNNNAEGTRTVTTSFVSIDLDPQLVITPFPHFGITLGPVINVPIGGKIESETQFGSVKQSVEIDSKAFHFGIMAGMLGYF